MRVLGREIEIGIYLARYTGLGFNMGTGQGFGVIDWRYSRMKH